MDVSFMDVIAAIIAIVFCIVVSIVIACNLLLNTRFEVETDDDFEKEDPNMDERIRKLFPADMKYVDAQPILNYIEHLKNEERIYKDQLKRIKQHIERKTLKSFEVDMGMSNEMSNKLMTETVVELQVIESMIDEVMEYEDYEEGSPTE